MLLEAQSIHQRVVEAAAKLSLAAAPDLMLFVAQRQRRQRLLLRQQRPSWHRLPSWGLHHCCRRLCQPQTSASLRVVHPCCAAMRTRQGQVRVGSVVSGCQRTGALCRAPARIFAHKVVDPTIGIFVHRLARIVQPALARARIDVELVPVAANAREDEVLPRAAPRKIDVRGPLSILIALHRDARSAPPRPVTADCDGHHLGADPFQAVIGNMSVCSLLIQLCSRRHWRSTCCKRWRSSRSWRCCGGRRWHRRDCSRR